MLSVKEVNDMILVNGCIWLGGVYFIDDGKGEFVIVVLMIVEGVCCFGVIIY